MDNQPDHTMAGSQRGGDGRFTRSPDTAARDAEAARLRARGLSYPRIAQELGYADHTGAYYAVKRALAAIVKEPAEEVQALELERLDMLWAKATEVLERRHVHVSGGGVVRERVLDDNGDLIVVGHDDDGRPIYKETELEDDGPALKAIETLLKIQQRRAALLGLDAEKKVNLSGGLKYEVVGVDVDDLT